MLKRYLNIVFLIGYVYCGLMERQAGSTDHYFRASAWLVSFDIESSFESFKRASAYVDEVNLFIYNFDEGGNIRISNKVGKDALENIIAFAKSKNIKIIPTIVNDIEYDKNSEQPKLKNPSVINKILGDKNRLKNHLGQIINAVESFGWDGIEIDYENIYRKDRDGFNLFLSELSRELKNRKKLLSVVVQPKTEESLNDGAGAQDWKYITEYADRIKIMCYNLHGTFSNAGPISTPDFVEEVIIFAKSLKLPEDRVYIALPLHGFIWSGKDVSSLTFEKACALAKMKNATLRWSRRYSSHYFHYRKGKRNYEVWFEDAESLARKLEILKKYHVKNVSLWRLGGEDSNIYKNFK